MIKARKDGLPLWAFILCINIAWIIGALIMYVIMDSRTDQMLEGLGYDEIKTKIAQIEKDKKWLDRLIIIMRLDQKRQEILTKQLEKLAEDSAKENK